MKNSMVNQIKKYLPCTILLYTSINSIVAQNIGINQPNPIWPLDISSPQCVARLITTTSPYGSVLELKNTNASAEYLGAINFNDPSTSYPGQISYKTNHSMSFVVGQQERMVIDNQGRLGIGTQTPAFGIDLRASQASLRLLNLNDYGPDLTLRSDNPNALHLGIINFLNFGGYGGQIYYSADHNMEFAVDNYLGLWISGAGAGSVGIRRAPITNSLEVDGNASKSTAGDWLANSDTRLKKNIKQLDSQTMLDNLLMLRGVVFEWNDDKTGSTRPEGIQFGFIAQDIQEVFPTLVEEDNLGYLQTAYGTYDPMMVEAIRALNEKIKFLENEIEKLRSDTSEK